jgi:hypothetical protein
MEVPLDPVRPSVGFSSPSGGGPDEHKDMPRESTFNECETLEQDTKLLVDEIVAALRPAIHGQVRGALDRSYQQSVQRVLRLLMSVLRKQKFGGTVAEASRWEADVRSSAMPEQPVPEDTRDVRTGVADAPPSADAPVTDDARYVRTGAAGNGPAQQAVLKFLREKGSATREDVVAECRKARVGQSLQAARKVVQRLTKDELIERHGRDSLRIARNPPGRTDDGQRTRAAPAPP